MIFPLILHTYCYGGLRKKLDIEAPGLPALEINPHKQQVGWFAVLQIQYRSHRLPEIDQN